MRSIYRTLSLSMALAVIAVAAQTPAAPKPQTPAEHRWHADAGSKMAFDVASVKPNMAGLPPFGVLPRSNIPLDAGDGFPPNGGFFSATNWPLSKYIEFAYKITGYQYRSVLSQMPKWAISPVWFDIEARTVTNPTKDQMRLMMQSLLGDRFRLAIHWEIRQLPVFALVLAKSGKTGQQLQVHPTDGPCVAARLAAATRSASVPAPTVAEAVPSICDDYTVRLGSGQVHVRVVSETMEQIAGRLTGSTNYVDRPLVDQTGLKGRFDFSIDFTPDTNDVVLANFQAETTGPTFLEALREQAGLNLVPQTGPVEVLVIDSVQKPSEN